MKGFKKWLAAAGLLLCLMAGSVSVYADPVENDTKTEDSEQSSTDRTKTREQDKENETPVSTETPTPTEVPVPDDEQKDQEASIFENDLQARTTPAQVQTPEETETSSPAEVPEEEKPVETTTPSLPKGNLTLAEDIVSKKNGNREFLTVYSREGDYFYIIIDRDSGGTGNVYFLNMVDDQDLYSLSGDAIPDRSAVNEGNGNSSSGKEGNGSVSNICTCVERCTDGKVDPDCPVCKDDPGKCKGLKTVSDLTDTGNQGNGNAQKKPELNLPMLVGGATALILLILFYFLKIRKKEKRSNAPEYNIEDYLTDEGDDDNDGDD